MSGQQRDGLDNGIAAVHWHKFAGGSEWSGAGSNRRPSAFQEAASLLVKAPACPARATRVRHQCLTKDQRGQDRIVPAPDDDLPFVLNVESACWITGRGTVIMGVIEQGVVHIGDHLEVIQPSSADTVAPPRLQCLDASPMNVSGRDYAALGYPIGIFVGPDIEPDAIRPGAKLRAVGH
jgi:hypothetical protein